MLFREPRFQNCSNLNNPPTKGGLFHFATAWIAFFYSREGRYAFTLGGTEFIVEPSDVS